MTVFLVIIQQMVPILSSLTQAVVIETVKGAAAGAERRRRMTDKTHRGLYVTTKKVRYWYCSVCDLT